MESDSVKIFSEKKRTDSEDIFFFSESVAARRNVVSSQCVMTNQPIEYEQEIVQGEGRQGA